MSLGTPKFQGKKPRKKGSMVGRLTQILVFLLDFEGLPEAFDPGRPYGERKKPIKKNHIKEFGGRDAPEASQGQTRDVPGTHGTFGPDLCVNQD